MNEPLDPIVNRHKKRTTEKPLGQKKKGSSAKRSYFSLKTFSLTSLVLVIIAAAASASWFSRPYREPTPFEALREDTGQQVASNKPSSTRTMRHQDETGAAIIKILPDGTISSDTSNDVIIIRDPTAMNQDARTAHLPDPLLLEESEFGSLPIISQDGRRPFDVYSIPSSSGRGAKIALVIGGMALSQSGTLEALEKLPSEISVAFAPYGNSINRWMKKARRKGHEVLMQVPFEPFDYPATNPGPQTITVDSSEQEKIDNLLWALGRTSNYIGIMNYTGARFMADEQAMSPIFDELERRGLMFLDDGSFSRSVAADMSERNNIPFAMSNTTIDSVQSKDEILQQLELLETMAKARGFAVGVGSNFPVTVDTVTKWANEAKKRGIEIVPLSALAAYTKG